MRKVEDSTIEQILTLYKEGKSLLDISKVVGVSKATASYYVNNAGMSRYNQPVEVTKELLQKMQEDYNLGMSKRQISKKYKVAFYKLEKLVKPKAMTGYEIVKNRRIKIKEELLNYKGGRCSICGYSRCASALEFHHLDPDKKDFGIAQTSSYKNLELLKKEIDKCILVCSNCHREIHAGLVEL